MSYIWIEVCHLEDIVSFSGVAALVGDEQVAIFRVNTEIYAVSNYDPFSNAFVLSRGIIGDRNGVLKVASPIYKQSFSLATGECLDDPNVTIPTWPTRVVDGIVQIGMENITEHVFIRQMELVRL
jgi:nitrite reductase (NADH) small subunit